MKYLVNHCFKKNKKIIIFQLSPTHTGSTVLVNILHGLLCYDKNINYDFDFLNLQQSGKISKNQWNKFEKDYLSNNINIIKTHNLSIDKISNTFSKNYDVYFVCSEREQNIINPKYHLYKNVIVFNYDELLESSTNNIEQIVNHVANNIQNILPQEVCILFNRRDAIYRIRNMNNIYYYIKDRPFSYFSLFYHLHGSHRNQNI